MAQIAELDQYRERKERDGGSRGPQVEDGYTRIANELFEAVTNSQTCPVTLRQLRVVLAVIRKTYGFQKKADRISDGQLAAETGLTRQNVNQAKRELLAMGVLLMDGHKIGINKHHQDWNFDARPVKDNLRQSRDSVSKPETKSVSKSGSHKRQKDITSPYGEESTAEADDAPSKSKGSSLPNCPHHELLALWAEIMPEKRQPIASMWKGARAKNLAARWKQGFSILNEQTGQPLYHDTDSGIEWWGRFFRFLRRSDFLMRDDSRFFGLDWVAKNENFAKILEMKYHGGDA